MTWTKEWSRKRLHRKKVILWYKEYKRGLKCEVCGRTGAEYPGQMEFHHIGKERKKMAISTMVYNDKSIRAIRREMVKCIVLCTECHMKWHKENGYLTIKKMTARDRKKKAITTITSNES